MLRRHGVAMEAGLDLRSTPALRAEVLAVLAQAGHLGSAGPSTNADADADGDPAERLATLTRLRDTGAITAAEFEEHKRRILSDI